MDSCWRPACAKSCFFLTQEPSVRLGWVFFTGILFDRHFLTDLHFWMMGLACGESCKETVYWQEIPKHAIRGLHILLKYFVSNPKGSSVSGASSKWLLGSWHVSSSCQLWSCDDCFCMSLWLDCEKPYSSIARKEDWSSKAVNYGSREERWKFEKLVTGVEYLIS